MSEPPSSRFEAIVKYLFIAIGFVAAGLCDDFEAGIEIARESIDSGKARDKLHKLIELTRQCKPFTRDDPMGE